MRPDRSRTKRVIWVWHFSSPFLAALRAGGLPKALNMLGVLVGVVGVLSLIPGLTDGLVGVFGLSQIIWFVWLGIILLRSNPSRAA